MKKATGTFIAAVAALALSGGAFAQSSGGAGGNGSGGSTASPANQVNNANSGYGTPGMTNSDSGMARAPNSGLPSSNNGSTNVAPAPKTNNTLATPSVASPVGNQ